MREADFERICKTVWRNPAHYHDENHKRMYLTDYQIRACLQAAIDLDIVRLNEDAKPVIPYSQEKVI